MTVTDTVEGTRGTASGSATATEEARRRIGRSPHALSADLYDIAAPLLTRDELALLASRREEVVVQLDALNTLAVLLGTSGDALGDVALNEAIFVLAAGIENAACSLRIANDAAATLREGGAA